MRRGSEVATPNEPITTGATVRMPTIEEGLVSELKEKDLDEHGGELSNAVARAQRGDAFVVRQKSRLLKMYSNNDDEALS